MPEPATLCLGIFPKDIYARGFQVPIKNNEKDLQILTYILRWYIMLKNNKQQLTCKVEYVSSQSAGNNIPQIDQYVYF